MLKQLLPLMVEIRQGDIGGALVVYPCGSAESTCILISLCVYSHSVVRLD